jgi:hypothetical protein
MRAALAWWPAAPGTDYEVKIEGGAMPRFRISSHGRLQDWVAVEHGYFEEEGLDYEFDVRALENAA